MHPAHLLLLCLLSLLSGCSSPTSPSNIEAARVTTQSSGQLILYPSIESRPAPTYNWPTPKSPVITNYSFHCHGASGSLSTEESLIFDCDGIKHLAKPFFVHPLLLTIAQLIHHHFPITVEEGYCCPMHYQFLQVSGVPLSEQHCKGLAAIVATQQSISPQMLAPILTKLYKGPPLPSKTITLSQTSIQNEDFKITSTFRKNKPILIIEIQNE